MMGRMKTATYVLQITEEYLKVVVSGASEGAKREIQDIDFQKISPGLSDEELTEKIAQMLRKAAFKNNPLTLVLPCNKATCRQFKVPAQSPKEIEKIVSLQASRYLPYPAEELVTGYQVISVSSDGYSLINLIIVHQDVISRLLKIIASIKSPRINVLLSSYGLALFYDWIKPASSDAVMFIDFNGIDSEVVILQDKQVLFNRAFRLMPQQEGFKEQCIEQIDRSLDIYRRESNKTGIPQIVYMSPAPAVGLKEALQKHFEVGVEELVLPADLKLSDRIKDFLKSPESSFFSLLGLSLEDFPESLNLLPGELKGKIAQEAINKERKTLIFFLAATLLIFSLGVNRNLENKERYLARLKEEINRISKEAAPLEGIAKRFRFSAADSRYQVSSLELMRELFQLLPSEIKLASFTYEEAQQVIIRGQAATLNPVFSFVGKLEGAPVFKNFKIKIRYATWRNSRSGALVDFEILCVHKNAKITE